MPLTDEQRGLLITELGQDTYAEARGTGNLSELVTLLNTPSLAVRQALKPDVLRAALMNNGLWARLRAVQRDPETPAALGAAADTAIDACEPGGLRLVNLDAPNSTLLLAAFENAGILSTDERTALLAVADTEISPAESTLGRAVTLSDLWEVLNA